MPDLQQGLPDNGRIQDPVRGDIGHFGPSATVFQVNGLDDGLPQQDHCQDDPHDAQRIGHGASQGRRSAVHPELVQRLLCGTQRRGIGRRPAEDADHIRQGDLRHVTESDGHDGSQCDHAHSQDVQFHSALAESIEKTGTDLQAQGINEDDQAEILCEGEHVGIDGKPQVSGQDSAEENEGHSQGDTCDPDASQQQAGDDDQEDHHHSLQGGLRKQQGIQHLFFVWAGAKIQITLNFVVQTKPQIRHETFCPI